MLRLRTLGGLSIEDAGSIGGATGNRRPLALLALLAVAGRRGLSRDKIIALLWPESDAEHGRNSLSQVISLLRRELPVDDVVLGTAELRVNPDVLACDVVEFEQRIAADDLAAAISIYTGPFLDGLFLKNTPEFERWVDEERTRLQRLHGDALEQLAARADAVQDHMTAVRFWRRRASLAPSDSRVARKLMESLVSSGDRAGALAHYRVHDALLRDDVGVEPDATLVQYAAAVRGGNGETADAPPDASGSTVVAHGLRDATGARRLGEGASRDTPSEVPSRNATLAHRARWIVAAAAVVTVFAAALAWRAARSAAVSANRVSQLTHLLPDGTMLHASGAAVSRDGATIVYPAVTAGTIAHPPQLYLLRFGELQAQPIPKTEGAIFPFFSPDGGSIGFSVGGRLKAISLGDGRETVIAEDLSFGGDLGADASWGEDGYILFGTASDRQTLGIRRVAARGGTVQVLSSPDNAIGEVAHYAPQRLPGTKTFIYAVRSSGSRGTTFRVVAQEIGGGPSRILIDGARLARYIDGGWLVYQIRDDVFVSHFDVRTLVMSGQKRVQSGVSLRNRGRVWAASKDVFIYEPGAARNSTLFWVSRDGTRDSLRTPPDDYYGPSISPSGDQVAVTVYDGAFMDAWIYDLRRSVRRRVSSDGISGSPMLWSSDSKRLTYRRRTTAGLDVYTRAADGSGSPELLFGNGGALWPAAWTRDMRTLVTMQHDTVTNGGDLWTLDRATRKLSPLVRSPAQEWGGRLSPDERWVAYVSDISGRYEVYVASFPAAVPRWQVSQNGGQAPVWSKDGRELFFRNDTKLLVAVVRPGTTFDWEPPRVLFEGNYLQANPGAPDYDVSPDGKRFLMVQVPPRGPPRLTVTQGWLRLGIVSAVQNR